MVAKNKGACEEGVAGGFDDPEVAHEGFNTHLNIFSERILPENGHALGVALEN